MTEHIEQSLRELGRRRTLQPEEKAFLKGNVRQFMALHPLERTAPSGGLFRVGLFVRPVFALGMAGILVSATGVAYAAEGALPGDFLYRVKTEVNEPVLSVFQITPEEKARFEIARTERRLIEAEALRQASRLTEEERERLEHSADASIERFRVIVSDDATDDSTDDRLRREFRERTEERTRVRLVERSEDHVQIEFDDDDSSGRGNHDEDGGRRTSSDGGRSDGSDDSNLNTTDEGGAVQGDRNGERLETSGEGRQQETDDKDKGESSRGERRSTTVNQKLSSRTGEKAPGAVVTSLKGDVSSAGSDSNNDNEEDRDRQSDSSDKKPELISESKAKEIALGRVAGTVLSVSKQGSDERPTYEVKIRDSDGDTVQVKIDAITGKVLDVDD